jgi:hypothetical protein
MSLQPLVWQPAPDRVIPLWDVAMQSPGDRPPAPLPLRWPDMAAGSILDFGLDCTALLAGGDLITAATVNPGALQLIASQPQGGIVYAWLTGGMVGIDYPVTITVDTAAGRHVARVVRVRAV